MSVYLWIAVGGALGSLARFALAGAVVQRFGEAFPWGTLLVNVLGSFVIGFFATATGPEGRLLVSSTGRQFFIAGVLGGFTTFSAFSLQTMTLARGGEWLRAGGNVVGSVTLCLVAVWLGYLAAVALNAVKGT